MINRGIRVTGRSRFGLEVCAARVRRWLLPDLPDGDPIDPMHLFEFAIEDRAPALIRAPVTVDVASLPSELEATTEFLGAGDGFRVRLSETSYKRMRRGHPRGLFTLVHEVGHLALHIPELRALTALPHRDRLLARDRKSHPVYCDSEWQADGFGAAIAMPAEVALTLGSADAIRRRFGVSYQAAEYRLAQLSDEPRLVQCWDKD